MRAGEECEGNEKGQKAMRKTQDIDEGMRGRKSVGNTRGMKNKKS